MRRCWWPAERSSAVRSPGPRARVPALRLRPSHGEAGAAYTPGAEQPRQATDARAAIRQLAGFGVAAIAFAGRANAAARAAADDAGIPLLQIPAEADLALLEREASHVIAERKRDLQRLGHDASRRLMEQAIAGESLADLAGTLAEMANKDVVIEAGMVACWQ